MSQIFHRSTNTFARITIFGAVFILAFLTWAFRCSTGRVTSTRATQAREQPVPFSHAHHVGGLGIDCRYCHTTVETSSFANIPPTKTCMNCHSQIWMTSPTLEPVRASFRDRQSHSLDARQRSAGFRLLQSQHPRRIREWAARAATAEWTRCRSPGRRTRSRWSGAWTATGTPRRIMRPREFITTMGYQPAGDQEEIGRRLDDGIQHSGRAHADELFHVPSMSEQNQ